MYPRLLLSDETADHCSLTSQVEHNLTLFEHNKKGKTTMTTYESSVKGLHAGEGETVAIGQERYTMKAVSADTGEALGAFLVITEPQAGPPPHIHHREDEAWYILEGNYALTIGDQVQSYGPGSFIIGPRNIPHTFKNVGKSTGRMLAMAWPAGFETFFLEIGQPVPDLSAPLPDVPLDIEKLIALSKKYDFDVLPPEE